MGSRIKETWIIIKEMFIKGADVPCGSRNCQWASEYKNFENRWNNGPTISFMKKDERGYSCSHCFDNQLRFSKASSTYGHLPDNALLEMEAMLDRVVAYGEELALEAALLQKFGLTRTIQNRLSHRICPNRSNQT